MASAVPTDLEPMEARLVEALPAGDGWQYEPKWDGFRCLAFRDGDEVEIMSKSGKSLARFFPEVVAMLAALPARRFVLDGELTVSVGGAMAFEALQARLHPAASRIARLSGETPAQFILFDCLDAGDGAMLAMPLAERRAALEALHRAMGTADLLLSPMTCDRAEAEHWLARSGTALDGVVAKRRDELYKPGARAMAKVKQQRSADCVIGGFRYASEGGGLGSLLLGLYDDEGRLHHVGFTSGFGAEDKAALLARLEGLVEAPGFTGKAPGGPSRWSSARSAEWQPLRPELVVEVRYDQVTGDRFRHGTGLLRWRPDKAPRQCAMGQLALPVAPAELITIL